jgi:hypothetical protein
VCQKPNNHPRFVTTEHINKNKWPDYPILKIADNNFSECLNISDDEITLLGWLMTDGSYTTPEKPYHLCIYQSINTKKNKKL